MADFIEDNATTNQLLRGNEHQKRVPKINYEIINRTSRFKAVYGPAEGSETSNRLALRFSDVY